jgi:plasmid maintenance system antidote protein VapI
MKKIILAVAAIIILGAGIFYLMNNNKGVLVGTAPQKQVVLEQTYTISKKYVSLRYKTDEVLNGAKNFPNYVTWNNEMSAIAQKWEALEKEVLGLEKLAEIMAQKKTGFNLIPQAMAYDKKEISDIFDNAPAGKKIATLAKHLGVDAKRAFKILQQDQSQVEADAWNEAGDTFQKLETSAIVIKDGCKVAGFIGGIAMTGGASALAAGSSLSQAAVIISGADLTLEITDDGAKIALGNNNKISAIVSDARKITEPLATILTIANIPDNLATNLDKFNAAIIALDQFNGAAQDGKIIGVELPSYARDKTKQSIRVAVLQKTEIEKWLVEQGAKNEIESIKDIEKILDILKEEGKKIIPEEAVMKTESESAKPDQKIGSAVGVWEGAVTHTSSQTAKEESSSIVFSLNSDGTVTTTSELGHFTSWEQKGNIIILHAESEMKDGQYEFSLTGDIMTFIKLAGPDENGVWQEIFAGDDFFGGKFLQIKLKKQ